MLPRFSIRSLTSCLPHVASLACLAGLTTSCGSKKAPETHAEPVAIQVGAQKIHLAELQADLDDLSKRRNPIAADASKFIPATVDRLTALEQAHQLGLDKDRELRRQWENLLIGRLHEQELEKRLAELKVTDAEIEEFYQNKKATYSRPAQLQLALLHLAVTRHTDEAKRKEIRAKMENARALSRELPPEVTGFGALAMEYSEEATSRFKGGDVGWMQGGASGYRWPDEVIKAAFSLKAVGDISEVIEASDGFYLLRKIDFREPAVQPLEGRFRSSVANAVLAQKREALEKQLKKSWLDAHPATIDDKLIQQLHYKKTPSQDPVFAEP
jgi:parvulin-like peptidyl-prolyl isomerase